MLVGARQKLSAISANTLQLDDITVALTESVKSFGILLDSTLFMENFMTQTSKSCYYQLRGMCWVRKYLNSTQTGYHCETGHLAHSVTPRLLQFSPFWSACFLYPKPLSHWKLCCSPHPEKCKTAHITPLFQSLHWLPIPERIQYKINTLCYECITRTAPFYFSNCLQLYPPPPPPPPVLPTLLILLASRILLPDSPLLVPACCLSSASLRGVTPPPPPFLSERNPLWTRSDLTSKYSFSSNNRPAMLSALRRYIPAPQVPVCYPFELSVN